jgi:methylmalonyl-CoA/ethylmalonyl-CoA epimerase
MIKRIEHIGIAVENLKDTIDVFSSLFQNDCYKIEVVESEFVRTAFFKIGESKIELLEATVKGSVIDNFLKKNGPGFHHIAFEVENIEKELLRLECSGFKLIHQTPKDGADNKRIAFLHPKSTNGVLIELCQEKI